MINLAFIITAVIIHGSIWDKVFQHVPVEYLPGHPITVSQFADGEERSSSNYSKVRNERLSIDVCLLIDIDAQRRILNRSQDTSQFVRPESSIKKGDVGELPSSLKIGEKFSCFYTLKHRSFKLKVGADRYFLSIWLSQPIRREDKRTDKEFLDDCLEIEAMARRMLNTLLVEGGGKEMSSLSTAAKYTSLNDALKASKLKASYDRKNEVYRFKKGNTTVVILLASNRILVGNKWVRLKGYPIKAGNNLLIPKEDVSKLTAN